MDEVTFAVGTNNYFNLPYWVADDAGLFRRHGLSVTSHVYLSIEEADQSLRSGIAPIGFQASEAILTAVEKDASLAIIGGNLERLPFTFIGRPGVTNVESLRGRTIGVSSLASGTSSLLRRHLAANGLTYQSDYRMIAAGMIPTRWTMLQDGRIDAGLQGIPMNFIALDEGYHDLGDVGGDVGELEFASLAVNVSWARANRDVVVRLLGSLIGAYELIYEDRELASAVASKHTGLSTEYAMRAWEAYTQGCIFPRRGEMSLGGLQAMLDLSGDVRNVTDRQKSPVTRYVDESFWHKAMETIGAP